MKAVVPSSSSLSFMAKATEAYVGQLDDEALGYLTGPKRGLTEETIAVHRFGVVRSPKPGHEAVRDYIAIPYLAPDGTVLSIRFRRLDAQDLDLTGSVELPKRTPKYRSMPGDIPRPYGTEALRRGTRNIVLTEGEFDRAVSTQCDLPAVGIPGANVWETVWKRLLVQFDGVFVLHDDDDAGRELVAKISNSGLDTVRPIPMVGGDVTSFYAEHGRDGLRAKVGA